MNLAQSLFEKQLKLNPQKIFITFQKKAFSFEEVYIKAQEIAHKLIKAGLKPQDKIAISFWNEPEFVFAYFGILLAQGISIPISPLLALNEINNIIKYSNSRLLLNKNNFDSREFTFLESQYFETAFMPKDLAVIIYTSGTTGNPKGVMLTYSNILAQIQAAGKVMELTQEDSFLGNLSLSHVFGQMDILWTALFMNCTIHLLARFEADMALKLLSEDNISILIAVPTMYQLMIHKLKNNYLVFPNLRLCHSGAAPMPIILLESIEKYFKVLLQEGYGLTETCSMAFSNPLHGIRKKGSVGLPIDGVIYELRDENDCVIEQIGQIGEVCIKGTIISCGYLGSNPQYDNWLKTGDLGFKDEDNYLFLVDRKKDLIIRGGLKIYPREIEDILIKHPLIESSAIVPIESSLQGQKPKAYLVSNQVNLSDSEKDKIITELKELCKKELAKFKIPVSFQFISEMPKTASGKILKRNLI